jgi:hypothetical protein
VGCDPRADRPTAWANDAGDDRRSPAAAFARIRAEHPDYEEWQLKLEYLREVFHPDPVPSGVEEWVRHAHGLPRWE